MICQAMPSSAKYQGSRTEEADDDPPDCHDTGTSSVKAVQEKPFIKVSQQRCTRSKNSSDVLCNTSNDTLWIWSAFIQRHCGERLREKVPYND